MKLSYSTLACPEWEIDKVIAKAKKFGYDGVELRAKKPQLSRDFSQEKVAEIKDKFSKSGIELPCITAYTRFNDPDAEVRANNVKELKEMIDLAADVGAKYVRTFGSGDSTAEKNEIIIWIREAFKELDDYAGQKDIKILLETHDDLSTGRDVSKIFKDSGLKNCGVVWDAAHSIRAGESVETTINYLEDYIYHVHLKDWINLDGDEDHYVLLAAGVLPLEKILLGLKEIDYKGYLSLEWEKMWCPDIEDSIISIRQYPIKINEYFKEFNL